MQRTFLSCRIDSADSGLEMREGVRLGNTSLKPDNSVTSSLHVLLTFWGIYGGGGVPNIRGTILGIPIIRVIVYWVTLGNYHIRCPNSLARALTCWIRLSMFV